MIATRSHTSSTSRQQVRVQQHGDAAPRSSSSSPRTVRRPAGSSALVGSSSSSSRGAPTSAWAIPSRCCMPFDIASTRRSRASLEADELEQLRRSAAPPSEPASRWCSSSSSSRAAPAREAEQLGEVAERAARRRRAGRCAADLRLAGRRPDEPAGDLDERRLAGAVRPEQPDELALADLEVDARRAPRSRRSASQDPGRKEPERGLAPCGECTEGRRAEVGAHAAQTRHDFRAMLAGEEDGGPRGAAALDRTDDVTYPKIELHVHLEGTVRPETLLEIARRNDYALPCDTVEELAALYEFRDFAHFIEVWILTTNALQRDDDFRQVVVDYAARGRRARRRLPRGHLLAERARPPRRRLGRDLQRLLRRRAGGPRAHGVEMRLTPDIIRGFPLEEARDGRSRWRKYRDRGVVGIGLGGLEAQFPPEPYEPAFALARAEGLASVPHAGEVAGPASVRGALDALGADRIRHGIRAVEDPGLVRELAGRAIVLDVCPISNLRTERGRVPRRAPAAAARRGRRPLLDLDRRSGDVRHRPHTRLRGGGLAGPRPARRSTRPAVAGALCDDAPQERPARDRRAYDWAALPGLRDGRGGRSWPDGPRTTGGGRAATSPRAERQASATRTPKTRCSSPSSAAREVGLRAACGGLRRRLRLPRRRLGRVPRRSATSSTTTGGSSGSASAVEGAQNGSRRTRRTTQAYKDLANALRSRRQDRTPRSPHSRRTPRRAPKDADGLTSAGRPLSSARNAGCRTTSPPRNCRPKTARSRRSSTPARTAVGRRPERHLSSLSGLSNTKLNELYRKQQGDTTRPRRSTSGSSEAEPEDASPALLGQSPHSRPATRRGAIAAYNSS